MLILIPNERGNNGAGQQWIEVTMDRGKGLKIIHKLLMESNVVERHGARRATTAKQGPSLTPEEQIRLGYRFVRTPENDAKFKTGETYLDTKTGRIRWVPAGSDPNRG